MLGFYAKNLREFTRKLFLDSTFDSFLVPEASFSTGFTSEFDGSCLSKEAEEPYITWETLRPIAFQLIKGRTLPRSFSLVFMLSRKKTEEFLKAVNSDFTPEEVSGLFLNVRYAHEQLSVTTGVSFKGFTADRSLDKAWDREIGRFLEQNELNEMIGGI